MDWITYRKAWPSKKITARNPLNKLAINLKRGRLHVEKNPTNECC
jgi:hypothetical protein